MNSHSNQKRVFDKWLPFLYRYGREVNTHDIIKIVAILLMLVDHVGLYLFDNNITMRMFGRGAAPLFYFLIGYSGKLNCKKRLYFYGFILSLTGIFYFEKTFWFNILYTFILAHIIMQYFPAKKTPLWGLLSIFIVLFMCHFFTISYIEYGTSGILITLCANWIKEEVPLATFLMTLVLAIHFMWQALGFDLLSTFYHALGISVIAVLSWHLFTNYRLMDIPCPKGLKIPALFISRYSLDIYFLHYVLLQAYFQLFIQN